MTRIKQHEVTDHEVKSWLEDIRDGVCQSTDAPNHVYAYLRYLGLLSADGKVTDGPHIF